MSQNALTCLLRIEHAHTHIHTFFLPPFACYQNLIEANDVLYLPLWTFCYSFYINIIFLVLFDLRMWSVYGGSLTAYFLPEHFKLNYSSPCGVFLKPEIDLIETV